MTTVRDIATRALRKIGVTDPNADEAAAAVDAFNDMLHGWRARGVDVWGVGDATRGGLPNIAVNLSDWGASAPFPLPEACREAAIYCLAERIAPEYGAQVAWDTGAMFRSVQAHYMTIPKVKIDTALRFPSPRLRSVTHNA